MSARWTWLIVASFVVGLAAVFFSFFPQAQEGALVALRQLERRKVPPRRRMKRGEGG